MEYYLETVNVKDYRSERRLYKLCRICLSRRMYTEICIQPCWFVYFPFWILEVVLKALAWAKDNLWASQEWSDVVFADKRGETHFFVSVTPGTESFYDFCTPPFKHSHLPNTVLLPCHSCKAKLRNLRSWYAVSYSKKEFVTCDFHTIRSFSRWQTILPQEASELC